MLQRVQKNLGWMEAEILVVGDEERGIEVHLFGDMIPIELMWEVVMDEVS